MENLEKLQIPNAPESLTVPLFHDEIMISLFIVANRYLNFPLLTFASL